VTRRDYLRPLLAGDPDGRAGRDRLEILAALIGGPSFDPVYRPDIIKVPRAHPVYRWECVISGCERSRTGGADLCTTHQQEWARSSERGTGKAAFVTAALGMGQRAGTEELFCQVCRERPASHGELLLCQRHVNRWFRHRRLTGGRADFAGWLAGEQPLPGYGSCAVAVCPNLAASPLGLCCWHASRYHSDGDPGGAVLPASRWHRYERFGTQIPVSYASEPAFRRWCRDAPAQLRPGQLNLRGLRPLVRAEIQWGLHVHAQRARPTRWDLCWIQSLVTTCRGLDAGSLVDFDFGAGGAAAFTSAITREILHELRLVCFTPAQSRDAGFLETGHFGMLFPHRMSHIDLTGIPQRWLRDLTWDYLAGLLRSPRCPRTLSPVDGMRRAVTELGAFLEIEAPGGGHDPALLQAGHAQRFAADQRHREREAMPSLAIKRPGGTASAVTAVTRANVFSSVRRLLRDAMDTGAAGKLGLGREFITAIPAPGAEAGRTRRRPFPDEVARALADEANLAGFAATYDPGDRGLRDVWETAVSTGRRIGEVITVRWDCIGRYGGLAMFWHDQTKVGNYDVAIRIPERVYGILAARQRTTLDRFTARYGYRPSGAQRAGLALFPTSYRSHDGTVPLTRQWFYSQFRPWVDAMDLGHFVPHQARHTLATSLLRQGATLTHVRRYLGQVSDKMAEHYIHLSHSDLEDVLQHVWVTGPGTASPGELLTGTAAPLTREQAQALAVDLSRRSTPAEGGFCTFQPVVDGGACPWNLDCHNCANFVLSGADLQYWQRKREQWRLLAERAPDDATAAYLHACFEPTARAIDGLEKALAGLGLLRDALALDLRKPQDYFHRVWNTAFRAADLATAGHLGEPGTADRAGPGEPARPAA
jgi:integrase